MRIDIELAKDKRGQMHIWLLILSVLFAPARLLTQRTARELHAAHAYAQAKARIFIYFVVFLPAGSFENSTAVKHSGTCESQTPCGLMAQPPESCAGAGSL